jgi:hypothetical protein
LAGCRPPAQPAGFGSRFFLSPAPFLSFHITEQLPTFVGRIEAFPSEDGGFKPNEWILKFKNMAFAIGKAF